MTDDHHGGPFDADGILRPFIVPNVQPAADPAKRRTVRRFGIAGPCGESLFALLRADIVRKTLTVRDGEMEPKQ